MPTNARTHELRAEQMSVMEQHLLAGHAVADVVGAAASTFRISPQTAYKWIRRIKKRWVAEHRREMAYEFGKALARREHLYHRALDKGDDALALRVEQDRCELLGLYPGQGAGRRRTGPVKVIVLKDEELAQIAGRVGEEVVTRSLPGTSSEGN